MNLLSKVQIITILSVLFIISASLSIYYTLNNPDQITYSHRDTNSTVQIAHSEVESWIEVQNESDIPYALGYEHGRRFRWYLFVQQIALEGRASELFGSQYKKIDFKIRTLGLKDLADVVWENLPTEAQNQITAYKNGINAASVDKGRWIDLPFAVNDIEPELWNEKHSIQLWLASLLIDNSSIQDDLFLSGLGMRLEPRIRSTLFQALPKADPSHPSLMIASRHSDEVLSIYNDINEIINHLNLSDYRFNGLKVLRNYNSHFESVINLFSASAYQETWLPINLKYQNSEDWLLTKAGIPFTFMKLNRGQNKLWILGSNNDQIIQIESTNRLNVKNPQYKSIVINNKDGSYNIEEFQLFEDQLILNSWLENDDTSNHGERLYRLNCNAEINDFVNTLSFLMQNSRTKLEEQAIPRLPLYHQFSSNNQKLSFHSNNFNTKNKESTVTWTPMNINPVKGRQLLNPISFRESGFMITNGDLFIANNEHFFNHWETDPFALEYIQTELLLTNNSSLDPIFTAENTTYSPYASKIVQEVLDTIADADTTSNSIVFDYFKNWNYKFESTSSAATLYEYFYDALLKNTFIDDLGDDYFKQFRHINGLHSVFLLYCLNNNSALFNDISTQEVEDKEQVIEISLNEAIRSVKREFGIESENWRWENYLLASEQYKQPRSLFETTMTSMDFEKQIVPKNGHWSTLVKLKHAHFFDEQSIQSVTRKIEYNSLNNTFETSLLNQSTQKSLSNTNPLKMITLYSSAKE